MSIGALPLLTLLPAILVGYFDPYHGLPDGSTSL